MMGKFFVSSGPLLFLQMASVLPFPNLVLLGMELCGGYSRDPIDPHGGPCTFNIVPLTSTEEIRGFLQQVRGYPGLPKARNAVKYVLDNVWSPVESIIGMSINMPPRYLGFSVGTPVANKRIDVHPSMRDVIEKDCYYVDLLLEDISRGVEYDGTAHYDVDKIASAAIDAARGGFEPGFVGEILDATRAVKEKAGNDKRRIRDLHTLGIEIDPITIDDLREYGRFESFMLQLVRTSGEAHGTRTIGREQRLADPWLVTAREAQMKILLPPTREISRAEYENAKVVWRRHWGL